jgi:hypothetical protein
MQPMNFPKAETTSIKFMVGYWKKAREQPEIFLPV